MRQLTPKTCCIASPSVSLGRFSSGAGREGGGAFRVSGLGVVRFGGKRSRFAGGFSIPRQGVQETRPKQ